jgi:FkbM family methyltransferase
VFDDDSTDGTWEILQKAAAVQDIRLARAIGERDIRYQERQIACYQYALREYAEEFEWLAFFDADEYLSLTQDDSVQSFLARFPQADQLCVNWCNYGSNGHYLKPQQLPIEAYTRHGAATSPINRHVKSFVRPSKVGPGWVSVHCYDIDQERSILSNGRKTTWQDARGVIDADPDWDGAKLMHYQCRSMEHFVERLRKRVQFQAVPHLWERYDINEIEDTTPFHLAARVRHQMKAISHDIVIEAPISDLIFDIGMSEGNDTAYYLEKGFRVVGVEPDVKIYYALLERFAKAIDEGQLTIHNLAAGATYGDIVPFFHYEKHQGLSGLSKRGVAGGGSSYHVMTIDWPSLTTKHGVPHYAKIDIEGHELPFLGGAADRCPLPNFISVECHEFAPVQALYDLGYRDFKLIDQNAPGGFYVPEHQTEGRSIDWPAFRAFSHSSGPFGTELPGAWLDLEKFRAAWLVAQPETKRTWFDCHAWMRR